jgi:ATPase subunit of ABC transporter with duplicated ATPase domains
VSQVVTSRVKPLASIIVTSHDRHFIGKLGTRVLGLSTTGPRFFNGTYDEYLERFGAEHLER